MKRLVAILVYTLLPLGYAIGESFDHTYRAWNDLLRKHVGLIDGGRASQVVHDNE
jgi:hypothetical protein